MTDKLSEVARAIRQKCAEIEHRPEHAPEGYVPDMMFFADEYAKAAIQAHAKALEAQGLVIVPREPTNKMVFAASHLKGLRAANRLIKPTSHEVWQAMIDAALEGKDG